MQEGNFEIFENVRGDIHDTCRSITYMKINLLCTGSNGRGGHRLVLGLGGNWTGLKVVIGWTGKVGGTLHQPGQLREPARGRGKQHHQVNQSSMRNSFEKYHWDEST